MPATVVPKNSYVRVQIGHVWVDNMINDVQHDLQPRKHFRKGNKQLECPKRCIPLYVDVVAVGRDPRKTDCIQCRQVFRIFNRTCFYVFLLNV